MTFDEALAQAYVRAASDADPTVDDTGFVYDRFIPGDRVERPCEHGIVEPDYVDGVFRCIDCDAPVVIPGVWPLSFGQSFPM